MRDENCKCSCAAIDARELYQCPTISASDFYFSCPGDQLLYIYSAEVGFSPSVKNNNTRPYCSPQNATCTRPATNKSAIMNYCHGERSCRIAQGVLNYSPHDKLCENHQNGNYIKIKYDCVNPGKYEDSGICTGLKVVPACYYRHVPICPFRHFCCRMYRLATKRTAKKRVKENVSVSFFWHTRWFIAHYLLIRTSVNRPCGFWSSRLSGFSFRWVHKQTTDMQLQSDSSIPADRMSKLVTTGFIVRQ